MTTDETPPATPPIGDISFYDNYIPTLDPGRYTISVTHTVGGGTPADGLASGHAQPPIDDTTFEAHQSFEVQGSRFQIPAAEVHSVYPPNQSNGIYELHLPHIVLNKRALPWEHPLDLDCSSNKPSTVPKAVPWLALVVFTQDELVTSLNGADPDVKKNPTLSARHPLSSVMGTHKQNGKTVQGPTLCLSPWESAADTTVAVIDMAPETFVNLVPTLTQAPLHTHVRSVDTGDKTILGIKDDGWFSVVISNRFPQHTGSSAPTPHIAHLVSIQGFENMLDADAPSTGDADYVRMISLYSWTFGVEPEGESFNKLMTNLLSDASQQGTNWLLKEPQTPEMVAARASTGAEGFAAQALDVGYAPLSYATRPGDTTFGWYRGPFVPVGTAAFLADNPPKTADDALIYDEEHGLFDLSYAVAFQTGRSVALSNKSFGVALLRWRRSMHRDVDCMLERVSSPHLARLRGGAKPLSEYTSGELTDLVKQRTPIQDGFLRELVGGFADSVAPRLGTPGTGFRPLERTAAEPAERDPVGDIEAALASPNVVEHLQASPPPATVVDFLASLILLTGVPFNNLVPDSRMLPRESLRFFYIDSNWLHALFDGAISIGAQTFRDTAVTAIVRPTMLNAVGTAISTIRPRQRGVDPPPDPAYPTKLPVAGMLLRSAAVSGYHALEVKAYADPQGTEKIDVLRLVELSPSVLLCLFPTIPKRVDIDEPREGLGFGIELEDPDRIELRFVSGANVGMPSPSTDQPDYVDLVYSKNQPDLKLLDVLATSKSLADHFPDDHFGPGAFALNMVRVPEQMVWEPPGGSNG